MRLREPFNAWSHLVGLLLASAGTVALLGLANRTSETVAFAIYGATLILLYAASTVYHALPVSPARLRALKTLDHIAIYFLIAGTYTPVALLTLDDVWGWTLGMEVDDFNVLQLAESGYEVLDQRQGNSATALQVNALAGVDKPRSGLGADCLWPRSRRPCFWLHHAVCLAALGLFNRRSLQPPASPRAPVQSRRQVGDP